MLHRTKLNYVEAALTYVSKTFSIITEVKEPTQSFIISVYDEGNKSLIEFKEVSMENAEAEFEELKTKYIFDYEKVLTLNK